MLRRILQETQQKTDGAANANQKAENKKDKKDLKELGKDPILFKKSQKALDHIDKFRFDF